MRFFNEKKFTHTELSKVKKKKLIDHILSGCINNNFKEHQNKFKYKMNSNNLHHCSFFIGS